MPKNMLTQPSNKYQAFPQINLPDRQWPDKTITRSPIWCSVDLRDGNQALAVPMGVSQKFELFELLDPFRMHMSATQGHGNGDTRLNGD